MLFMQCYLWSTILGRVGSWEVAALLLVQLAAAPPERLAPRLRTAVRVESYYIPFTVVGICSLETLRPALRL